ncbi:MAG: CopG family ribbon-helix-helix protein [Halodesulfurarchaeum sp.]
MTVLSVSMPEALLDRLDRFAGEHGYTGRSEVVREASRNLLEEFADERLEGRELMGVLTVIFEFDTSTVEERMIELRHEYEKRVTENVHSHVGNHYSMELFVLEGPLADISGFVGRIRATKDVRSVDYSVMPVDELSSEIG